MTVERVRRVAQEVLVRAAVDSFTSQALMTVDAEGLITSWSAGAEHLLGYPAARAVGHSLTMVLSTTDEPGSKETIAWLEARASDEASRPLTLRLMDGSTRILHTRVRVVSVDQQFSGFAVLAVDESAATAAGDSGQLRSCKSGRHEGPHRIMDSPAWLAMEIAERTEAEAARLRLLQRLVTAQEEERRRIAQNLHDDLGQQLTSLRLTLDQLRATADAPSELAQTGDAALAILSGIDDALEFLAWELRPAALEELDLAKVLEGYVAEWSRHSSIAARFHSSLSENERFAPEVETTVYRIAQEALNNVAKHSRADTVNVILEARGERLVLAVEDDGVGCGADVSHRTMGVSGMQERAAVVGGTVELEPTPRGGTTVLARLPMVITPRAPAESSPPARETATDASSSTPSDAVPNALRRRVIELQTAVSARDEFIATVAHELRNPIAPLVFQLRLALDKTEQMAASGTAPTAEWMQTQLRRMEHRLHRLLETLDRLLDVSRLSTGRIDLQPEPIDLTHVVQEVLTSFEAELGVARCAVSFSTCGETTGLWDRVRLEQIGRNLISNAIRFGAGQPIAITLDGDATVVTLTVRDHGVGIAPSLHARIFERFERGVEQRSGGFGIGLWVVKNVCNAMGGAIAVESEPGEGACFTVTLPRRVDQAASPAS